MSNFYDLFRKEPAPSTVAEVITPVDPERATRYARKALESECDQVANAHEGERNHTLNRAAFNISQLVAAGHLDEDVARTWLWSAAREAGLSNPEIKATLASGFRAGALEPRIVPDQPPTDTPNVTTLDTDPDDPGPPLNPLLDWNHLFTVDDDEEEWIVEPILPARRMVALYSAPKAGKSLLMLELAVGIATGGHVLGTRPDRPRRVLYVDFENDPRGDIRTRLENMAVGPHQLGNLCYLSFPQLAKFDTHQGAVDLARHVDAYECEVVVIDTVSRAVQGEENENDTWLAFYRHTGLALKRAGVACIRLDHTGKDQSKGMRGGSAKYGDVDAVWSLTVAGEDTIVLECTANRMPVPTKLVALTRVEDPLRHVLTSDPEGARYESQIGDIMQRLEALGLPNDTGVNECVRALKNAGQGTRKSLVGAAVKRRKLAPATLLQVVPEPPGNHREPPREVVPGGGSIGTTGTTRDRFPEPPARDTDLQVGCRRCFRPTTAGHADTHDGLCANCHRETGAIG